MTPAHHRPAVLAMGQGCAARRTNCTMVAKPPKAVLRHSEASGSAHAMLHDLAERYTARSV
ncbi:hypothetical protein [Nonomuraea dietziae]|uniref:hypothetical protein n=1 Tax=Nonomuraea dietziae TaxID=65515 RepID=UPI0033CE1486